jgi:CRISPR/Cas system-associated protein Csm6
MSVIHKVWNWVESDFVLIAGLATSLKWVWEYSQGRKFEKNKFLLERVEKFNILESTKKVQKILDWNAITIEINGVNTKIDDSILVESLKTHDQKVSFDSKEVYIREIFDDYFTGLTELIILSKTGLVDKKNLKRFLQYWIDILNGTNQNKQESFVKTIENYLNFYGYTEVLEFLK